LCGVVIGGCIVCIVSALVTFGVGFVRVGSPPHFNISGGVKGAYFVLGAVFGSIGGVLGYLAGCIPDDWRREN
jgi:hypothetical protein